MARLSRNLSEETKGLLKGTFLNFKIASMALDTKKYIHLEFVEIFREHVEQNPKAEVEEVESCIGCMTVPAEIKLIRRCENSENSENPCVSCYCRPMWCLQCLGKWFAMRQDQNRPETWLASKCPCPTCRSRFCILDVSLIQEN